MGPSFTANIWIWVVTPVQLAWNFVRLRVVWGIITIDIIKWNKLKNLLYLFYDYYSQLIKVFLQSLMSLLSPKCGRMKMGRVDAVSVIMAHSFQPMLKITLRLIILVVSSLTTAVNIVKRCSNLKILCKLTSLGIKTEDVSVTFQIPLFNAIKQTFVLFLKEMREMREAIKEMLYRLDDGRWGCTQCQFCSNRASSVEVHVESKHLITSGFVCPVCNKHCPTKNALNIHKFRYHREDKLWKSFFYFSWSSSRYWSDWKSHWWTRWSSGEWPVVLLFLWLY